jgi:hypothetical protein
VTPTLSPPPGGHVLHAEDRSAVRWPMVFHAVLWLLLLVASSVFLAINGDPGWSWLPAVTLFAALAGIIGLVLNGPTGTRVTTSGVSIGAARRQHHPHAAAPPPSAAQRFRVFSCPWPAVRSIEVAWARLGVA